MGLVRPSIKMNDESDNPNNRHYDDYIYDHLEDLVLLLGSRHELSPERAANEILLCILCYAADVLEGPFEEPIKTLVAQYRQQVPPAPTGVVVALRARRKPHDDEDDDEDEDGGPKH